MKDQLEVGRVVGLLLVRAELVPLVVGALIWGVCTGLGWWAIYAFTAEIRKSRTRPKD